MDNNDSLEDNLYNKIGLEIFASSEEVEFAYSAIMDKDKTGGIYPPEKKMMWEYIVYNVKSAYSVLSDPKLKAEYDQNLHRLMEHSAEGGNKNKKLLGEGLFADKAEENESGFFSETTHVETIDFLIYSKQESKRKVMFPVISSFFAGIIVVALLSPSLILLGFYIYFLVLSFPTILAVLVYLLLSKNKYALQERHYNNVNKTKESHSRAFRLFKYFYDKNKCNVCQLYKNNFNEDGTHSCSMFLRRTEKNGTYSASLSDWTGAIRWHCGHWHSSEKEAYDCGGKHYIIHVEGLCSCAYFPPNLEYEEYMQSKNSYLYIMINENLYAVKIGISSRTGAERIIEHSKNGWKLAAVFSPLEWKTAYKAEQSVLEQWRVNKIPFGAFPSEMPQKGYTETAALYNIDLKEIVEMVEGITNTKPAINIKGLKNV